MRFLFYFNEMNKIALVTGSYRGLGLETARQLLEIGYIVIISSRSNDQGIEALNSLRSNRAFYHQLDVTNTESIELCMVWIKSKFKRLDVLITLESTTTLGIIPSMLI